MLVNQILYEQGCNDKFIPIEGILLVVTHAHSIKDKEHYSVLCVVLATPKSTPQCNVSNIRGNNSERYKCLQVLYQTSKRFTVHLVTHINL